jgi:hypothetical protein
MSHQLQVASGPHSRPPLRLAPLIGPCSRPLAAQVPPSHWHSGPRGPAPALAARRRSSAAPPAGCPCQWASLAASLGRRASSARPPGSRPGGGLGAANTGCPGAGGQWACDRLSTSKPGPLTALPACLPAWQLPLRVDLQVAARARGGHGSGPAAGTQGQAGGGHWHWHWQPPGRDSESTRSGGPGWSQRPWPSGLLSCPRLCSKAGGGVGRPLGDECGLRARVRTPSRPEYETGVGGNPRRRWHPRTKRRIQAQLAARKREPSARPMQSV